MLHDHSGFDRTDPDAAQALEHALPIVAELLGAERLPQPKNVDELRAWREHIAELTGQVARIAERGGVDADELRERAKRKLCRQAAQPAPIATPADQHQVAAPTFGSLALDDARLNREIAQLERDAAGIAKTLKAKRGEQRKVHRQLFGRRRTLR